MPVAEALFWQKLLRGIQISLKTPFGMGKFS